VIDGLMILNDIILGASWGIWAATQSAGSVHGQYVA